MADKKTSSKVSFWRTPLFAKLYAVFGVGVLLATTTLWALIGARIHQSNADQLVDPYLFEHSATLHGAQFPGQHTFLLKWPVFWLLRIYHFSSNSFLATTVALTLLTVGVLAFVLYRIERRPLVFGTLCLALASVLMLIPAQPYPGALLPVNMAMLTTRNLEYVFYIAGLWCVIRAKRLRSWYYGAGIGLLAILIASDKLFLTLGAGAAILMIMAYGLLKRWTMVTVAVRWLTAMVLAAGLSTVILNTVNRHYTHIVSGDTLSPYGLVQTPQDVGRGLAGGVMGLGTNFGANPVDDYRSVGKVPTQIFHNLFSVSGLSFAVNALILAGCLFIAYQYMVRPLLKRKEEWTHPEAPALLSLMLLWSTAVAFAIFIGTEHSYPVDARYLSISLFAGFIAGATYLTKRKQFSNRALVAVGLLLLLSIFAAIPHLTQNHQNEEKALHALNYRNRVVADVLDHHPVEVLVGDYWRVLPTRLETGKQQHVMPLRDCLNPRRDLTSTAWSPDLTDKKFAYLLTLDNGSNCTLEQITNQYGKPNSSVLIEGTLDKPKELLLFYDRGINKSGPVLQPNRSAATVVPISLEELPHSSCPVPTIMQIVAHEDDDLLFMNPDLYRDIKAGHCIRTVYITAGDAGAGSFYWLSREQGAEAAYSKMLGINNIWVSRLVKLADGKFITVANPQGVAQVSLIFIHMPDGNLKGQGFRQTDFESISQLAVGSPIVVQTVDHQSKYTGDELVAALVKLMHLYQPAEVRTQSTETDSKFPDHSDHMKASSLATAAYTQYEAEQFGGKVHIPIKFYRGYTIRSLPENVSGQELADKAQTFMAYAQFDHAVCGSMELCNHDATYHDFLHRQYHVDK